MFSILSSENSLVSLQYYALLKSDLFRLLWTYIVWLFINGQKPNM